MAPRGAAWLAGGFRSQRPGIAVPGRPSGADRAISAGRIAPDWCNREGTNLEFRAEAFNLFNRPQFSNPGSVIGTPAAGVVTSTAVANRQAQLALRLTF